MIIVINAYTKEEQRSQIHSEIIPQKIRKKRNNKKLREKRK